MIISELSESVFSTEYQKSTVYTKVKSYTLKRCR